MIRIGKNIPVVISRPPQMLHATNWQMQSTQQSIVALEAVRNMEAKTCWLQLWHQCISGLAGLRCLLSTLQQRTRTHGTRGSTAQPPKIPIRPNPQWTLKMPHGAWKPRQLLLQHQHHKVTMHQRPQKICCVCNCSGTPCRSRRSALMYTQTRSTLTSTDPL